MLNYKSHAITSTIPRTISDNYPQFIEFVEAYYDWRTLATFELKQVVGSFDLANYIQSVESNLTKTVETVVESNKTYTVRFDDRNTFINDEDIWSYRLHTEPVPITSVEDCLCFDGLRLPSISVFRGQTYYFENKTGSRININIARTQGNANNYGSIVNNGTEDDILSFTVNDGFPNFLYVTSPLTDQIIVLRIIDVPIAFAGIASENRNDKSIFGISKVDRVLLHVDYLNNVYEDAQTFDAPNALFNRFLTSYGLEAFFRNNFADRKFFNNFTEFFKKRGSEDGIKFFFRNFFDRTVSFDYPGERVIRPSQSDWFSYDEMFVRANFGEELLRSDVLVGKLTQATATIESVKYFPVGDYYKLFMKPEKRTNEFVIGEPLAVLDSDDPTIQHDIDGKVLGNVADILVTEAGNEYDIGQTIVDTYNIPGIDTTVSLTVDDITSTDIRRFDVVSPGSGYAVNDLVYFPTPEKKLDFSGIIQPEPGTGATTYTSTTIAVEFEDYTLYEPIDFTDGIINIQGTRYDVVSFSGGSPDSITIESQTAIPVTPTVQAGQLLTVTLDEENVTDPFFDENGEYFHPSTSKVKRGARAYVSSVTASGGIDGIQFVDNGAGYVKRPTTSDSSITIITTSGNSADIDVIGQRFGGVVSMTPNNDLPGIAFDTVISVSNGTANTDDYARVQLRSGVYSKYGEFFNSNEGFVSDNNYIHDSFFYQDYSYVIQSDLNISEFSSLLKQLAHPAGMIFFNEFFITRVFNQKLNRGSEIPVIFTKITIETYLARPFTWNNNLSVYIQDMLVNVYVHQFRQDFNWASSSILDLESTYSLLDDPTISGTTESGFVTVSGYEDVVLQSGTPINRDTDENYFVSRMYTLVEETVSGVGTVSYDDTSSGELYSQFETMVGSGTSFLSTVAYEDMIYVIDNSFYVQSVDSDTQLTVQRLNTSNAISLNDEPYLILIRRRTEIDNARFIDVDYFGDNVSISGHLTKTWDEFLNTVYIT